MPQTEVSMPLYVAALTEEKLHIRRKLPPKTIDVDYSEIASFEHKRLPAGTKLIWAAAYLGLAYAVLAIEPVRRLVEQLLMELGNATGYLNATILDTAVKTTVAPIITLISAVLIILAANYVIGFAFSLGKRLIIFRSGKRPLSFPLPPGAQTDKFLSELKEKVTASASLSKAEIEHLINDNIRGLLDQRIKMQRELIESLGDEIKAAKNDEERSKVKEKLRAGMDKLEAQDELIDRELEKTGLSKEQLFKKYRIQMPKEEFIDSILKEEGIDKLKEG